jgi:hypothetical protein
MLFVLAENTGCENTVSLQLDISDYEMLKCKAYGCEAVFEKKVDLAEHYCSLHVCYGGPPNDALGQQIYTKCLAALESDRQKTIKRFI